MSIREHYLRQIRPFIGTDVIKVITGMRRSGKSVILEQIRDAIQKDHPDCETIYFDFENRANVPEVSRFCRR